MEGLRELKLRTNCGSCADKCCSQPYDWVYLTSREVSRLKIASALTEEEFVVSLRNEKTGHVFHALSLPCRFLDAGTGQCTVYEERPLVCRLFPFSVEPLTGVTTLARAQCGDNLDLLPADSDGGWCLVELEEDARQWFDELWEEAQNTG